MRETTTYEFLTFMRENHQRNFKLPACNMTTEEVEIAYYLNAQGLLRIHIDSKGEVFFYASPFNGTL